FSIHGRCPSSILLFDKGSKFPIFWHVNRRRYFCKTQAWLDITLSNPDIQKFEKNDAALGSYGLAILGKLYAGDTDPNHYLLSPINGDIQGLGEISLFIGTHDLMLADARKFRDRAKKEGIMINYYEYSKMNHVFPALPIPEAKKAIRQIIDLIS
ncbi:alpha/beta hydrolase, partial [Paenibacillus sp. 32O-W]|uniref:alpha/beta hydrolase n=1 Tax=Paenibacillus sp. 32O-W TaxID=1695218 RepID=UPI0011A59F81